jgi:hypothetical protein
MAYGISKLPQYEDCHMQQSLRSESTEIKKSRAHTHYFEGRAHLVRACKDASGVIMWGMHTKGGTR